ncbi:hypothetical protein [Candidatus Uabimicrobium sp. HlEnr_7]|uniref:hypothetical protein n=1 Tax=Candidatus Uabimicrobium helgolandensis TaxID=3095367 RepID=UPI003558415C
MQIFRGSQDDLKRKYELNPLIVTWMGILRSRNVFCTEPVLELCRPEGLFEQMFKDRTFIASLENQSQFNALQQQHNTQELFQLILLDNGNEKVIALEDEVLAEQGWNQSAPETALVTKSPLTPKMNIQGVEHLFGDEEIARLKMVIATTVSSSEKIEAIRKISLSQVDEKDKSLLFLHTLGDSDVTVRSEAASALEKTGFNEQMGNAIIALCTGDSKQKIHAISSLGNLFVEASEFEKGAILQIFLTTIKDKDYHSLVLNILEILSNIIPNLPANQAMIERIMLNALENLISDFDRLYEKMYQIFNALKELDGKYVGDFLWQEIKKSSERRLRAFLLTLIVNVRDCDESKEMMVLEVGFGDEIDPIYIRLNNAIKSFGKNILDALIQRFQFSQRVTEKIQLLQIMQEILSKDIPSQSKNEIVKLFIRQFATAHKALCIAIMEMRLLDDKDVSIDLRLQMAKEMLVNLDTDTVDQYHETVRSCLTRMNSVAITAILEILENPISTPQAIFAGSALGDIVLNLTENVDYEVQRVEEFCFAQIEEKPPYVEEMYKVLGRLTTVAKEEQAKKLGEYLIDNICKSYRPYAVIEALSWVGLSQQIEHELKFDVGYLFMSLLDRDLSGNFTQSKELPEKETLYEIDSKVEAFTGLIPFLIKGLERMAVSENTPLSLKQKITQRLLSKWEDVLAYKMIWGPKNTLDLAHALQQIALATDENTKNEIIEALFKKIEVFSITELLVDIFTQDFLDEKVVNSARITIDKLLEFNKNKDFQNPEDKAVVMRCIGKMATAKKLDLDEKKSEQLRERLVFSLFEGLRERVFRVKHILQEVLNCNHIPKKLKQEIEKRLP